MSDNLRIDSALPETNDDNKEQSLVSLKTETDEKFKDNNEVAAATGDNNITVDSLLDRIVDTAEVKEDSSNNENSSDKNALMVNGEHNNEPIMTTNNVVGQSNNLNLQQQETQPIKDDATTTTDNNQINTNAVVNNSLSLLAQYDSHDSSSSSSSESSSDAESSSSMDVDSADSESSVSSIHSAKSLNAIKKKIDEFEGVDDDEEPEEKLDRTPIKAIGELGIEDLPPIEDLHITVPEKECNLLGKITSIVDQLGKEVFCALRLKYL